MKNNQKGAVSMVVVVLAVVVVAIAGYFMFKKSGTYTPPNQPQNSQLPTNSTNNQNQLPVTKNQATTTDETANWQTYRNEKYGFEFKYPKSITYTGIFKGGAQYSNPDIKEGLPLPITFEKSETIPNSNSAFSYLFPGNSNIVFSGIVKIVSDGRETSLGLLVATKPTTFTSLTKYAQDIQKFREAQGQGAAGTNNRATVTTINGLNAIEVIQSDFSTRLNTDKNIILSNDKYLYILSYAYGNSLISGFRTESGEWVLSDYGDDVFARTNYNLIQEIIKTFKFV